MKTKNWISAKVRSKTTTLEKLCFKKYLEKRLTSAKIAEIDRQAELEVKILRSIQALVSALNTRRQ